MILAAKDYERLLAAVSLLNSDSKLETLPARTLESVFSLVPNEMVAFDGFGTDGDYSRSLWYSPPDTVPDERIQILADLLHEHPFYQDVLSNRAQRTVRVSEYIPLENFHRTALYNEFYRFIGGDSQMCASLVVSPELYVACSLHRVRSDFSDREWKMIDLLAPHLVAAFRGAQFIQKLTAERELLETAIDAARYGVVTTDLDSNIQSQNPTASKLLLKYLTSAKSLPDELRRYLKNHCETLKGGEFYLPPESFEVTGQNARLKIKLAFESNSQTILLLLEEIKTPSPKDFIGLGLTRRESEILYWIACGKTNQEISVLCCISPRTVKKHLQNIFQKLGVETRTAAALRAMDFLRK